MLVGALSGVQPSSTIGLMELDSSIIDPVSMVQQLLQQQIQTFILGLSGN